MEPLITEIVEQKLIEILGDPDSGYELKPAIKARLLKRTKPGKNISAQKVARDLGLKWWRLTEVEFTPEAATDLARLDTMIRQRVLANIRWLSENFNIITPTKLTGNLRNICKLRIGDWRVFYEYQKNPSLITIRAIGNRREIYRIRS